MVRAVRGRGSAGHLVVGSEWLLASSVEVWRLRALEPVAWARVRAELPLRTGACLALRTPAGAWLWARVQACLPVEGEPYVVELGLLIVPPSAGVPRSRPAVAAMSPRAE